MEIMIAGAGLAGLATACHLAQAGHAVRVFEQARALTETGAGIQLSANAVHALAPLGLGPELARIGTTPRVWRMRLHDSGEIAGEVVLGQRHADLHGQPYYVLHRASLQGLLVATLERLAPGALILGARAEGFDDGAERVTLRLAEGREAQGDLLVVADGIHSALRAQIAAGAQPVYTGYAAWRGMVPADRARPGTCEGTIDLFMGPGQHSVMYRIKGPDGADWINFVALTARAEPDDESWTTTRPLVEFRAGYAGWHPDFTHLIDGLEGTEGLLWSLFSRDALPRWRGSRTVLVGDAAHPTMPNIAQGAAMALEDAAVLARALAGTPDVAAALETFERARLPRTTRVVNAARQVLKAFHGDDPEAIRAELRNGQSSLEARDTWLYNYDPTTVPV